MRLFFAFELFLFFLWELTASNLKVARQVFSLGPVRIHPGFLVIPLDLKTDLGITAFANMISLTPGTVSVDVLSERSELLVHCMFAEVDKQSQVTTIKRQYERRILRVFE